ncbi:hypothetical protein C6P46_005700 [Rhodotorula mucilaginosa]|uniref:Nuclear pore complex protein Nup85 n=1 Tax=Rhodotorula mucilaginosa TaxID=5537 RepID=A0A9P6VXG0_RHOMI|nr:hypothetical protein C6P46_005700 [Rhodotorula mucilaginosa]
MAPSLRPPPSGAAPAPPPAAGAGADSTRLQKRGKLKESRQFIIETYTVWASLQRIVADYETEAIAQHGLQAGIPPPEQVQYYARNNTELTAAQKAKSHAHYADMGAILALTEILYLPADGRGEGLVAEEILDWVNTVDKAPSADEGNQLLALASPWDSPNFFPYLHRCLLRGHLQSASALLSLLVAQHPAPYLQAIARILAETISTFPRSTNFRTESAFATALRAWRSGGGALAQAKSELEGRLLTVEAESDPVLGGADNEDERHSFEQGFRIVLEILAGDEDALVDSSSDWREALAAFGLWSASTSLRRADLPAIVDRITSDAHPVDASLPKEVAELCLFKGDVAGVLKTLAGPYPWLGTHVADLLSHLHLPAFDLPPPPPASMTDDADDVADASLGLREHFLLDWAQRCVSADPGLWRIACEYWSACGRVGRDRARELVKRLEIVAPGEEERDARLAREREEKKKKAGGEGMDVEGPTPVEGNAAAADDADDIVLPDGAGRRVDELLLVCSSLDLEDEFFDICGRYADYLVERKRYGEAVAYAVRAGDGTKVARIAEMIGEEYVVSGQEAFVKHVDSLPTSLLRPSSSDLNEPSAASPSSSPSPTNGLVPLSRLPSLTSDALRPHLSRLAFLARYRDFLALYAAGARREAAELLVLLLTSGVAPKKWWAVMLLDAVPLLETNPVLVSLAETYELLRILEELLSPIVVSSPPRDIFGSLELLGRLSEGSAAAFPSEEAAPVTKKGAGTSAAKKEQLAGGEEKEKEKEGERLRRAMGQMDVVRASLARHLATCCCLE